MLRYTGSAYLPGGYPSPPPPRPPILPDYKSQEGFPCHASDRLEGSRIPRSAPTQEPQTKHALRTPFRHTNRRHAPGCVFHHRLDVAGIAALLPPKREAAVTAADVAELDLRLRAPPDGRLLATADECVLKKPAPKRRCFEQTKSADEGWALVVEGRANNRGRQLSGIVYISIRRETKAFEIRACWGKKSIMRTRWHVSYA